MPVNLKAEEKNIKPVKKIVPPQLIRGMHDILPAEWAWWNFILESVESIALSYSFGRIETPILEKTQLFTRAIGSTTDIVEKEMFSFIDQSEEHLSLRPEYTAGIARAYIEHGMISLPQPVKLFSVGPNFRHERPQAGRFRQFWQFDFEVLGEAEAVADSQLILTAAAFFERMSLPVTFNINSVGCPECRVRYRQTLIDYYRTKRSELSEEAKKRLQRNPLRLLDSKEEAIIEINKQAPQLVDYLCENCRNHFVKVLEHLDEVEFTYQLAPYLVRGLDYYTRTVFEVWGADGAGSALAGGGRYDNLLEELGGRPTPAVGFSGGMERIVAELKRQQIAVPQTRQPDIFIASLGEAARKRALKLFEELRRDGIKVAENFTKSGLKAQLETANKLGASFTLVLGQKELMDSTIIIRDMENGIQETVDLKKVISEITKRLAHKSTLELSA
ncbi:MAG: histidine--tRNA ligase [Patescibacteria group bacterium]